MIRRISLTPDSPFEDEPPPAFDGRPEAATRLGPFGHLSPSMAPTLRPERRMSERAPVVLDLEFGADAQFYAGLSFDISEGGIFVSTYQEIPIGTCLSLCFELPDGTSIEARGEVRWACASANDGQRPGIGIAFTELAADARERIAALCAQEPPLYFEV